MLTGPSCCSFLDPCHARFCNPHAPLIPSKSITSMLTNFTVWQWRGLPPPRCLPPPNGHTLNYINSSTEDWKHCPAPSHLVESGTAKVKGSIPQGCLSSDKTQAFMTLHDLHDTLSCLRENTWGNWPNHWHPHVSESQLCNEMASPEKSADQRLEDGNLMRWAADRSNRLPVMTGGHNYQHSK